MATLPIDEKDKSTAAVLIDPKTGKPVEGGVGQLGDLAAAMEAQAPGSPAAAAAMGASPDAAKMVGAPVAPTSQTAPVNQGSAAPQGSPAPGGPIDPADPKPQQGQTLTPEQRVAAAFAPPPAGRGGAQTDLAAALRYAAPAGPSQAALAAGRATAGLAQATGGLSGLDDLMARRLEAFRAEAIAATKGSGLGSSEDVGLVAGQTYSADDFIGDKRTPEERLADATKAALKRQADYRLTAADLKELGFDGASLASLREALGRDPIGATAAEVQKALAEARARAASEGGGLRAAAVDTRLGDSARRLAAQEAQGLDATTAQGLQDVTETLSEVERGDTIRFGGQDVKLSDVLSDERVSNWVKEFAAASPEDRKKMAEREPDLAAWVESNEGAIREAVAKEKREATDKAAKATQEAGWLQSAQDLRLGGASQSILDEAKAGSKIAQGLLDPKVLAAAGVSPATVGRDLQALQKAHPQLYAAVLRGDYGKDVAAIAKRLGLGSSDPADKRFSGFVRHAQELKAVEDIERKLSNGALHLNDALDVLFPKGVTLKQAQELLTESRATGKWTPQAQLLRDAFDPDGDGKISAKGFDAKKLVEVLKKAVAGGKPIATQGLGDLLKTAQATGPARPLLMALGDKKLDEREVPAVVKALGGARTVADIYSVAKQAGVPMETLLKSPAINKYVAERAFSELGATISKGSGGALPDGFLKSAHNAHPSDVERSMPGDAIYTVLRATQASLQQAKDPKSRSIAEMALKKLQEAADMRAKSGKFERMAAGGFDMSRVVPGPGEAADFAHWQAWRARQAGG